MKVEVKTAKAALNGFDFEDSFGTTTKFYQTGVVKIIEVRKGSSFDIEMASMHRIDPMPLPPMSQVRFHTRFFYVPMIDICPYFNEMDNRTPYVYRYGQASSSFNSTIPLKTPIINSKDIKLLLFNDLQVAIYTGVVATGTQDWFVKKNDYIELVGTSDVPFTEPYDLAIRVTMPVPGHADYNGYAYFKYTDRGRVFFKLLKETGYDFAITNSDFFNNTYKYNSAQSDEFSALPLLAYVKVYLNYYESSQYINTTVRLNRLNSLLHIDHVGYSLSDVDLDLICDLAVYVTYELDYFTTAFVNPANGNNFLVNNESIAIDDITTGVSHSGVTTNVWNNGAPSLANQSGNGFVTQNAIDMLRKLTSYLRRHQIAGGRMVDRALVEYGVSIDNSYSRRCSYIDSIDSVMNITPVLNTTSDKLGEYAGFGSSFNDMNNNVIHVDVPEQDGFILAITTVIPEVFYSQGYCRQNRHITKWDFVAGSTFDAVGVQAIEQGELLMSKIGKNYVGGSNPSALSAGFKPRGAEYKESVSRIAGDFIVDSVNTDIEGYFTNRYFDPLGQLDSNGEINITTSRAFVSSYDSGQYSRIFYINSQNTDYIKSIYRFKIHMSAPFQELYEQFKLSDEQGNNTVRMTVGGQTLQ